MEWQFLVNCADDFEAGLIMGALDGAGIINMRKYRGSGDYMKVIGGVGQDVDIFVPEDQLPKAQEVLDFLNAEATKEEHGEEE